MLIVIFGLIAIAAESVYCQCGKNGALQNYYFCAKSRMCIELEYTCDREDDCGDCQDESNCTFAGFDNKNNDLCEDDEFYCATGKCISVSKLCNAENDCEDCSDEHNCPADTYTSCKSPPPEAENAQILNVDNKHGGKATYICNKFFRKVTYETVQCSYGTWQGGLPVCQEARCDFSTIKSIAGLMETGQRFYDEGESFTPSCIEGYSRIYVEDNEIHCIKGEWSGHLSPCEAASCRSNPPEADNGQMYALDRNHGGIIRYLCNEHYRKIQEESVICNFGKWQGSPAICKNTQCYFSKIKSIAGLKSMEVEVYEHEDSFTPSCTEGYSLSSDQEQKISCHDGEWVGDLSPCKPASCESSPPKIENAEILIIDKTHGGKLVYECIKYYRKVKDEFIICYYGKWQGSPPQCKDTRCYFADILLTPGLNQTEEEIYESGQSFIPTCKEGYTLANHNSEFRCNDGNWTGDLNPCIPKSCNASLLPEIENGELTQVDNEHGGNVAYSCDKYYRKVQIETINCQFGKWQGFAASCKDTRCYFSKLNFAGLQWPGREEFEEGQIFSPACVSGFSFVPTEDSTIRCKDGEWEGHTRPCEAASCINYPPDIENGEINSIQREHGGNVTYKCNQYYRKIENEDVSCYYGIWIGSAAVCKDTRCYFSRLNSTGIKTTDKEIYESEQSFIPTCIEGYTMIPSDDNKIRCEDGRWEGHVSPCQPASCESSPPEAENAEITSLHKEHGGNILYACNKHFKKVQPETVTCQYGAWEGSPPLCEKRNTYSISF